jgi:hypothetical protein
MHVSDVGRVREFEWTADFFHPEANFFEVKFVFKLCLVQLLRKKYSRGRKWRKVSSVSLKLAHECRLRLCASALFWWHRKNCHYVKNKKNVCAYGNIPFETQPQRWKGTEQPCERLDALASVLTFTSNHVFTVFLVSSNLLWICSCNYCRERVYKIFRAIRIRPVNGIGMFICWKSSLFTVHRIKWT